MTLRDLHARRPQGGGQERAAGDGRGKRPANQEETEREEEVHPIMQSVTAHGAA